MFPIADLRGRVVAFGGRALEKDAPAKYLNSPETPLFHKGATLYNVARRPRRPRTRARPLIAVEGYVDVIAMVTAGFAATVAPLGTALTDDQLALLWKMADEPMLCFDGDARRPPRRLSRGRPRAAAAQARQEPPIRPAAGRAGPRRSGPLRRARRGRGRDRRARVRSPTCCGRARPRAGAFDTPERRAALEARVGEVTRAHRRRDRAALLPAGSRRAAAAAARAGAAAVAGACRSAGSRGSRVLPRERARRPRQIPATLGAAGAHGRRCRTWSRARSSRPVRASRPSRRLPRREALILLAVLNHPWLLHDHLEDLASSSFAMPTPSGAPR